MRPARPGIAAGDLERRQLHVVGRISLRQGQRPIGKPHVEMAVGRHHRGRSLATATLLPDHVAGHEFGAERDARIVGVAVEMVAH